MRTETLNLLGGRKAVGSGEEFVVTIGSFDGVHRGHGFLIREVVERAQALSIQNLVVTFDPLPSQVLEPNTTSGGLSTVAERLQLLSALGVYATAVVAFTSEFASLSAEDFLEQLCGRYRVREIWAGPDFAFGYHRQGDITFLSRSTTRFGFGLHVVPRQIQGGAFLSSSSIRKLVVEGRVSEAAGALGHYSSLPGKVERGAGRGRQLGYPTANLALPWGHLVPATGIYAGYALLNSRRLPAAISIGYNPTFGSNPLSVEAYILDFDEDIFDREISLEFVDRIRGEAYFASAKALVSQIDIDVLTTRGLLSEAEKR